MGRSSALFLSLLLALPLSSLACVKHANGPIDPLAFANIKPAPIEDRDFAEHLHAFLKSTQSDQAAAELRLGVVKQELTHASTRFERGSEERAMKSVLGAFYLLRQGDPSAVLVDAKTARAFEGAVRRVSARGDIGKARALLTLLLAAKKSGRLPGPTAELEAHIADLDRWVGDTRKGSGIEKVGEAERAAVSRVLVEPTKAALDEAAASISAWIDMGIEHNIAFRQTGRRPTQEEAIESTRALESGSATLVAMYLRLGDLDGAITEIEATSVKRVIDPDFYRILKTASSESDGRAWKTVFAELDRQTNDKVGGEIGVDEELLDAAFFNVALEAYRRDSSDLSSAVELSRSLVSYGMSEAVPLVLTDALGDAPRTTEISASARWIATALEADERAGDYAATSRTIAASAGFIAATEKLAGKTGSLAPLRYRMAAIEAHTGNLDDAKKTLEAAVRESPSPAGILALAEVQRQLGDPSAALQLATRASDARDATPLEAADASYVVYQIERQLSHRNEAGTALERSLRGAIKAKSAAVSAADRVRAERTLGRVLLAYGETVAAGRAFDRALEQVSSDRSLIGATLLRAMGYCLLTSDVAHARLFLKKGREAGADQDDLVYAALVTMLLEKQTRTSSDGTLTEIFEGALAGTSGAWVSRLAAWAVGKVSDSDLVSGADSAPDKIQALFYVAMKKRASGSPDEATLRGVARSPVLDLLEVDWARELTLDPLRPALPKGLPIP